MINGIEKYWKMEDGKSKDLVLEIISKRAFSGKEKITYNSDEDSFIFQGNGNDKVKIQARTLYVNILTWLDYAYQKFETDKDRKDKKIENLEEAYMVFAVLSIKSMKMLSVNNITYDTFQKIIDKRLQSIKKDMNLNCYEVLCILVSGNKSIKELMKVHFNIDSLKEDDIEMLFEKLLNEKLMNENKEMFLESVITNKVALKQALKMGYLTPEDLKKNLSIKQLKELFEWIENPEFLLKYVTPDKCIELYKLGIINEKELKKYCQLNDILESEEINKNDILDILVSKRIYRAPATKQLWKLYEEGKFSVEEMQLLTNKGYVNTVDVMRDYLQEQKKKISLELKDKPDISDEKLMEYFNPNQILKMIKRNNNEEILNFVKENLMELYDKSDRDLEIELVEEEKKTNHKDDKELKDNLLSMYERGIVDIEKFSKEDITEEDILKLYNSKTRDVKILIEGYNAGLLSQETILSNLEEDEVFEQIKKGLNADILEGYYGTVELVNLYKSGKIGMEDIHKLRASIDVEKVQELYNSNELSYEELFELSKNEIISEEKANEINDKYDIEADLKKLAKNGGITGIDIDEYRAGKTNDVIGTTTQNSIDSRNQFFSNDSKIDETVKDKLFGKLGAGERVRVNCKLFDGYVMIPFVDKKLAVLEGDGRTYIVPIKIVLEQVNNRGSENDIIGNAVYRRDLYSNTEYVKTVNHTANWGRNLIEKMGKLNNSIDSKSLIMENKNELDEVRKSYEELKGKRLVDR